VIFSSRQIPGNEVAIGAVQNALAERGVHLITERDHPGIHVSGHPARGELRQMYQWARPEIAIPTHGERRHLMEHVILAKELQVPQAIAPHNGEIIRLAPGRAEIIDEVPNGRLYVDGGVLTPANGEALRERIHASNNGVLMLTLALDKRGKLVSNIDLRAIGLPGDKDRPLEDALDDLADLAEDTLRKMDAAARTDDEALEQALSRALKKASQRIWDRRRWWRPPCFGSRSSRTSERACKRERGGRLRAPLPSFDPLPSPIQSNGDPSARKRPIRIRAMNPPIRPTNTPKAAPVHIQGLSLDAKIWR
jgi:ribonuclease J